MTVITKTFSLEYFFSIWIGIILSLCRQEHWWSFFSFSDVFLLGGDDKDRFKDIKTSIDKIRKNCIQEDNTNDEKRYFNELINNIRFNGIPWNVSPKDPEVTGDPSITVVVDNYSPGERSMVIAQYVQKMLLWEVFVGVLIIVIPNKKAWFWIDPTIENNLQSNMNICFSIMLYEDLPKDVRFRYYFSSFKLILNDQNEYFLDDYDMFLLVYLNFKEIWIISWLIIVFIYECTSCLT